MTDKGSVIMFVYVYNILVFFQYINVINTEHRLMSPFIFCPAWFSWTIRMAYSKAQLQSNVS
jgi:hypothetical protein